MTNILCISFDRTLGARCRRFESCRPDQKEDAPIQGHLLFAFASDSNPSNADVRWTSAGYRLDGIRSIRGEAEAIESCRPDHESSLPMRGGCFYASYWDSNRSNADARWASAGYRLDGIRSIRGEAEVIESCRPDQIVKGRQRLPFIIWFEYS